MFKVNNVVLTGNIATDVEVREIGDKFLHKFTIAVDSSYKKDENWVNQADFIPIEYWGYTEKDFVKGEHVGLTGSIKQSTWESDGKKRSKLYVKAVRLYKTQKEHYTNDSVTEDDDVPF